MTTQERKSALETVAWILECKLKAHNVTVFDMADDMDKGTLFYYVEDEDQRTRFAMDALMKTSNIVAIVQNIKLDKNETIITRRAYKIRLLRYDNIQSTDVRIIRTTPIMLKDYTIHEK